MGTATLGAVFRVVATIILCLFCQLAPARAQTDQRPGPVIGPDDAVALARYYAPYAILANVAYRPIRPDPNNPWEKGLDSTIGNSGADINLAIIPETGPLGAPTGTHDYPHSYGDPTTTNLARRLFRAWHYQFGHDGYLCLDSQGNECKNVGATAGATATGIAYQVWAHTQPNHSCNEVGLAFRGTTGSGADWKANFHWLFNLFTVSDDEYSQLGRNIDAIIRRITRLRCYGALSTQIISVGDSLGGGLAQFAAFAVSPNSPARITKVYAFNSSPVAALDLIQDSVKKSNGTQLTIDRVNQQGQILSTYSQNWLLKPDIGATACNPFVRTVSFAAITPPQGRIQRYAPRFVSRAYESYELHDIGKLSAKLVQWSYVQDDDGRLRYAKYIVPSPASDDCKPAPLYREPQPEPEYGNEPVSTSFGIGRDFYASADYARTRMRASRYGSTLAPSADADYRAVGYRPDGSYGPIVTAYSDQTSSRADRKSSSVKATRVHSHRIAALPRHKMKKIRTARS